MSRIESLIVKKRQLLDEHCDCVISLRSSTACWRCRKLRMVLDELAEASRTPDRGDPR